MTNSVLILFASILKVVSNVGQLFAADDLSRRHFLNAFFLALLELIFSKIRVYV